MRSKVVSAGLLAVLTTQLVACADDPQDEAICMEESTQNRAEDDNCQEPVRHGYSWVFYRVGSVSHPPVGQRVAPGFSTVRPASGFRIGGVPRTGGFGTHGGSVGG